MTRIAKRTADDSLKNQPKTTDDECNVCFGEGRKGGCWKCKQDGEGLAPWEQALN
jgi:hypothetical protein